MLLILGWSGSGGLGCHLCLHGSVLLACLDARLCPLAAVPEAVGRVAGLRDVAVVREPVDQCRGHFRITEDAGPLAEDQVGRNHDAGVLVELSQQVEKQRPATLRKR